MTLVTRKSNPNRPARVLIYGDSGVGKSTFGAKSDSPIFISAEGGTDQLTDVNGNPVEEMQGTNNWDGLLKAVTDLIEQKHDFKTLVIDSADWVESICHAKIIGGSGKSITTANGGYGAGYRQSQAMHKDLINLLSILRDKRDMNIIITAHSHIKASKNPSVEDHDQHEIKCHEFVSSLWREWVDGLFFVSFNVFVKKREDSDKNLVLSDGKRTVYTTMQPYAQAKNRYGMPPEMEFTEDFWNAFRVYSKRGAKPQSELSEVNTDIRDMLAKVDPMTRDAIVATANKNLGNVEELKKVRDQLRQLTKGA